MFLCNTAAPLNTAWEGNQGAQVTEKLSERNQLHPKTPIQTYAALELTSNKNGFRTAGQFSL